MNPLLILGGIFLLGSLMRRESNTATNTNGTSGAGPSPTVTPDDIPGTLRLALRAIVAEHGAAIARNVERIYRLETGNFTSGLFKKTNAAGMRAFSSSFPFGWKQRGTTSADYLAPVTMAENAGGPPVQWVVFRSLPTAMGYLADFLADHGNNAGRWNSTDPAIQENYRALVNAQAASIVDDIAPGQ